jgi:hypothetical protein
MIAVTAAGMVQMSIDQIVVMVAVRHHIMPAAFAMLVCLVVAVASVFGGAFGLVRVFRQGVLVDMIAVHMVQMIVVQVTSMVAVLNRFVSTRSAVSVFVIVVSFTGHGLNLFRRCLGYVSIFTAR